MAQQGKPSGKAPARRAPARPARTAPQPGGNAAQDAARTIPARAAQLTSKWGNSDLIVVGCKMPNGLHLELPNDDEASGKTRFTLRGCAVEGNTPGALVDSGGYALTYIPKDFWEEWCKAVGPNFGPLRDRAIIAYPRDKIGAAARDHEAVDPHAKPLDPEAGARSDIAGVSDLKTHDKDDE